MSMRELSDAVEVIPDKLYWVALHTVPRNTAQSHYFSIDQRLVYEPFYADFGPLNLAMVYRYCKLVEATLREPSLQDKRLVHYCSHDPGKRANAAFLICAYQVIVMRKPADAAFEPFTGVYPPFLPFRDALRCPCTFHLSILDCLKGLEFAMHIGWFDYQHFNVESYEFYQEVENGDMNWIVPDRFLAFAGPCPTSTDTDGYPAFTPEDYVPIFKQAKIELVVRLNTKLYDRARFIDHGIKHVDLYFKDGSCPGNEIIARFLHIAENEPGAIAVHCKAGLGRTGTLIGLYCMKHFQFPARAFIGWNRICRPGSILGQQQQFMCDMQNEMFQAGAALRRLTANPSSPQERSLAQQMASLNIRDRTEQELREDVGQGEFLVNSRRNGPALNGGSTAPQPPRAGAGPRPPLARQPPPPLVNGRGGGGPPGEENFFTVSNGCSNGHGPGSVTSMPRLQGAFSR